MLYSAAFIVLSYFIHLYSPYDVDRDVQLVCKYLKAYHKRDDPDGIDRIFRQGKHTIRCTYR